MNSRVGPAGTGDSDMRLRQAQKSLLDHTLHSPLDRLPLPAGKGPSIVLNDQLKGAAWHLVKLGRAGSDFKQDKS